MRWVVVLLCLLATPVWAGAWPRARGQGFAAPALNVDQGGRARGSLYVEYGLTDWLTLGLDAPDAASTVVFARLPLWASTGGHRLAVELGAGAQRVRMGLSYGRGLDTRWGSGWIAVDGGATFWPATGQRAAKLDATLGISPSDHWKAILQVQGHVGADGARSLRLAPAVVVRLRPGLHLEAGVTRGLMGDTGRGIKLGLWVDF